MGRGQTLHLVSPTTSGTTSLPLGRHPLGPGSSKPSEAEEGTKFSRTDTLHAFQRQRWGVSCTGHCTAQDNLGIQSKEVVQHSGLLGATEDIRVKSSVSQAAVKLANTVAIFGAQYYHLFRLNIGVFGFRLLLTCNLQEQSGLNSWLLIWKFIIIRC